MFSEYLRGKKNFLLLILRLALLKILKQAIIVLSLKEKVPENYPLSFAGLKFWFLDLLGQTSSVLHYIMCLVAATPLEASSGTLDVC